jgi:hypothetical protein
MRSNWLYMLMACVMSVTMWYMVTGQERVETLIEVRVEFKGMPAGLIVRDGLVKKVSVRLRGPKGLMRSINEASLTYAADLSTLKKGTSIVPVVVEKLPITRAFEVVEVTPSRLVLEVDSVAEREVPVDARVTGTVAPDVVVEGLRFTPAKVRVRGPESVVDALRKLHAEVPPPPADTVGDVLVDVPVVVPELVESTPAQLQVAYRVTIARREVVLSRQVRFDDMQGLRIKVAPAKVSIRAELPRSQASDAEVLKSIEARIELPEDVAPGVLHLPVHTVSPDGVRVDEVVPDTVTVTIQKR